MPIHSTSAPQQGHETELQQICALGGWKVQRDASFSIIHIQTLTLNRVWKEIWAYQRLLEEWWNAQRACWEGHCPLLVVGWGSQWDSASHSSPLPAGASGDADCDAPFPSCPEHPFPSLKGSTALVAWLNLAMGCCNEIKVSIFKECFIHYILEMYRKWSKN